MPIYNPYNPNFIMQEWQGLKDRIDKSMQNYQNQYQFMQPQQQAPITQNFQITPQQNQDELQCAYVKGINDVKNTFVIKNGIFVNRDLSTLWFKDVTGDIKTYDLKEVIELDEKDKALLEKDKTIENMQKQIDELKGAITYANQYTSPNTESDGGTTQNKSTRVSRNKSNDGE